MELSRRWTEPATSRCHCHIQHVDLRWQALISVVVAWEDRHCLRCHCHRHHDCCQPAVTHEVCPCDDHCTVVIDDIVGMFSRAHLESVVAARAHMVQCQIHQFIAAASSWLLCPRPLGPPARRGGVLSESMCWGGAWCR